MLLGSEKGRILSSLAIVDIAGAWGDVEDGEWDALEVELERPTHWDYPLILIQLLLTLV
jgi:hypothetical protein